MQILRKSDITKPQNRKCYHWSKWIHSSYQTHPMKKSPMSDPTSDPSVIAQFWASLPEPIKAAIMNVILSTVMAFRNKERTFWTSFWEVTSGGVITFVVGSTVEAFGFSSGWGFAIGGAIAVFGIDQAKAFAAKFANKKADISG